MTTTMQMEPSPLETVTAPAETLSRENDRPAATVDDVPSHSVDTAVDPLSGSADPTNGTTGGTLTSEPESLPDTSASDPALAGTGPERSSTSDSTTSGTGGGRHAQVPGLSGHVLENHENAPTFKEKVQGFAKVFRGSTLGKEELKEEGKRVLAGEKKLSTS